MMKESIERKVLKWMAGAGPGDTGLSSKQMAYVACRVPRATGAFDYPHDPADLLRCVRLLEQVPEVREHFDAIALLCHEWGRLIERWDELTDLLHSEMNSERGRRTGEAPKTYELMQNILREAAKERVG